MDQSVRWSGPRRPARGLLEFAPPASICNTQTTTAKVNVGDTLLWVLSAALILLGLAGTVLPALPGTLFVLAGIVLGAWIDDFSRVGWGIVSAVGVLAVLAWVLDYVAGLLGARKAGASRQALIGAALGTVAGIFTGLVGVLFMPLVGAAVGEYLARRDHPNAIKVGVATWLGIMAGLVAKVVIAFMMIGLFVAALIL
jgi:uncharacterized protein YqgC (DUF456 family)